MDYIGAMTKDDLPQRLKKTRQRLGLSQLGVATECAMSQGHYSRLEIGTLPIVGRSRVKLETWLLGRETSSVSGSTHPSELSGKLERVAQEIAARAAELGQLAAILSKQARA